MTDEIWRDIPGYDGDYQVSNYGRVRSLKFDGNRILKSTLTMGYPKVVLCNREQKDHYIHRLVAAAFLPVDDERPCVNHKDGNRANNHVSNLEWCTQSENIKHAWDNLGIKGRTGYRIMSDAQIGEAVAMRYQGISSTKIAQMYGIDASTVARYMRKYAPGAKFSHRRRNRKEQAS